MNRLNHLIPFNDVLANYLCVFQVDLFRYARGVCVTVFDLPPFWWFSCLFAHQVAGKRNRRYHLKPTLFPYARAGFRFDHARRLLGRRLYLRCRPNFQPRPNRSKPRWKDAPSLVLSPSLILVPRAPVAWQLFAKLCVAQNKMAAAY